MFTPRLALLSLVAVLLSGLTSAVTLSPEFQKTLEAGLNKLKQQVKEYPKLQSAVDGIPMDAAGWAALSRDDIVTTLRFFSDQKASALKNLLITDPSSAPKVEQFTNDSFTFITTFVDNIKSGAFTSAPAASTPAPTTKAPEGTTAAPTVTTAAPTVATTTEATTAAPTETANTNSDGSASSGSAGETVVEETKPATTKPPASTTTAPAKTSAATSLVTTVAPAVVGAVTAAFFALC